MTAYTIIKGYSQIASKIDFQDLKTSPNKLARFLQYEAQRTGIPVDCKPRQDGGSLVISYKLSGDDSIKLDVHFTTDLKRPRVDFRLTNDYIKVGNVKMYDNLCVHTIIQRNDLQEKLKELEEHHKYLHNGQQNIATLKNIVTRYNEDGLREIHTRYPNTISNDPELNQLGEMYLNKNTDPVESIAKHLSNAFGMSR